MSDSLLGPRLNAAIRHGLWQAKVKVIELSMATKIVDRASDIKAVRMDLDDTRDGLARPRGSSRVLGHPDVDQLQTICACVVKEVKAQIKPNDEHSAAPWPRLGGVGQQRVDPWRLKE
jgi:hypothetical protein